MIKTNRASNWVKGIKSEYARPAMTLPKTKQKRVKNKVC